MQMLCICKNKSIADLHLCAKRLEALDVKINRSAADIAASRKRYDRLFILSKQC